MNNSKHDEKVTCGIYWMKCNMIYFQLVPYDLQQIENLFLRTKKTSKLIWFHVGNKNKISRVEAKVLAPKETVVNIKKKYIEVTLSINRRQKG